MLGLVLETLVLTIRDNLDLNPTYPSYREELEITTIVGQYEIDLLFIKP